jgi:hypothetical protein
MKGDPSPVQADSFAEAKDRTRRLPAPVGMTAWLLDLQVSV